MNVSPVFFLPNGDVRKLRSRLKEIPRMPNDDFSARDLLERLRKDEDGVASFEYIIVAVLIIAAVGVGFRTGALSMTTSLAGGFGNLTVAFSAAL